MGVDGIDKADIFDEYFGDDKPKITNFEKIKAMDIDEMAEWLEYFVYAYTAGNLSFEDAKEILLESEVRE